MKAMFRCDAGPDYGLGRLTRCWALADAMARAGVKPVFAVWGGDVSPIADAGYEIVRMSEARGAEHDRQFRKAASEIEMIVIDTAELGAFDIARLQNEISAARFILMDDHGDRYVNAHAVVNPNLSAYLCRYESSMECKTILGLAYALIRPDVLALHDSVNETQPSFRILLALGAYDPKKQVTRLLKILDAMKEDFEIAVMLSEQAPGIAEIKVAAGKAVHPTSMELSHKGYPEALMGASLAVCGGGTTAQELACLGIPTTYLSLYDHADESARIMGKNGLGVYLGKAHAISDGDIALSLEKLIRQESVRASLSRTSRAQVDGKGAERLIEKLTKYGLLSLE
jgi:UDP-2,4-diacetamido-2,4,6-trideoxy-beta-L-altropyranose hydrolase